MQCTILKAITNDMYEFSFILSLCSFCSTTKEIKKNAGTPKLSLLSFPSMKRKKQRKITAK
jgi:hypothetical protein